MQDEHPRERQDLAVYDRQLAVSIAGGNPQIAAELFDLLIQELPHQREALSRAYTADDRVELRKLTHKLVGSASYCGTPALKAAAQDLEAALPDDEPQTIADAYAGVLAEICRVMELHGSA